MIHELHMKMQSNTLPVESHNNIKMYVVLGC